MYIVGRLCKTSMPNAKHSYKMSFIFMLKVMLKVRPQKTYPNLTRGNTNGWDGCTQ